MLVNFIKFFHMLLALGTLGSAVCCLFLVGNKSGNPYLSVKFFNKLMLGLGIFALVTGTFLVYPKHFTFATPWIQAAYALVLVIVFSILGLMLFGAKLKNRWIWRGIYFAMIVMLILVIHDAVTKTTLL